MPRRADEAVALERVGQLVGGDPVDDALAVDEPVGETLVRTGVAPNELTNGADRDWLAGTPWHKSVPARLEPVTVT